MRDIIGSCVYERKERILSESRTVLDEIFWEGARRMLPVYLRRVPSVEALIPVLYLKGIWTGDFTEELEAILGPSSRTTVLGP